MQPKTPEEELVVMGNYRKSVVAIGAAALLAVSVTAPAAAQDADHLQRITDSGRIVMSTDALYPPQSFIDPDTGAIVGFDLDVGEAIAERLGVTFVPFATVWDVVASGRWADRWDMSVGSMTITPERQEVIDFTRPYRFDAAGVALREGVEADSLEGLTVCVGSGTTYFQWLEGTLTLAEGTGAFTTDPPENVNVVTRETDRICADEWASGRSDTDAWVSSQETIAQAVEDGQPVVPIGDAVFGEPLAVAFDNSVEDNDSLVARVDEIIGELRDEGVLSELSMKWYGADLTTPPTQ